MNTEVLPVNAASLAWAASFLRRGEVVAFPTETVYGLGADALNPSAVAKIFEAKARPADNPLIAHIDTLDMLPKLALRVDARARVLMDAFWPGALTLIFPRTDAVPDIVSAGLDTVAVRMPSHPAAQALIREAGCPIAAPSANRSGRPSPTTAQHVLTDMDGRIPLILDGGACGVGLESTVVDMTGDVPIVLRPGGVTVEMLRTVLPDITVDGAVLQPLAKDALARSPGMRHRHYAPNASITIVRGPMARVIGAISGRYDAWTAQGKRVAILCADAHVAAYGARRTHALGGDAQAMATHLYDALRLVDAQAVDAVLAEAMDTEGIGLALMNRLLRAADFDVLDTESMQGTEGEGNG